MIPATVLIYLGDQAQCAIIMSQYFQTIHKWIPIISRVRLTSLADSELGNRPRADFALLLLTMKLIQDVPGSSSNAVRDAMYICAKEFAASLEIAGVYTLLKLQANLLIAVYEMGHGIFPAAYASMGCCVTQAMVLGIHNRDAPQVLEQPRTWIDWEERQRQAMYPERLILSSSKHLSASPFARLAQASHLQGEVIKHCNDNTRSLALVQNDVEVLSQVLWSFLEVIGKDRASMMHFYSSVGVCLSALMKLCDHHSCDSFAIYNDRALDVAEMALAREIALRCQSIMKDCIAKAMSFVEVLREMVQDQESIENLASLSPWFLDSIYQCLANIVYLMATTPAVEASGYPSQVSLCMDLLRKANQRWNVSGAYLEAIDLIEQELKIMSNRPNLFEPLQPIGENLYLYESSDLTSDKGKGPSLIVLFTWLGGATATRIQKYLLSYRTIWPAATILLVTTRVFEFAAAPSSAIRARLKPARDAIRRHVSSRVKGRPSILFHVFSNGGLHTAIHLTLSLRDTKEKAEPLDLRLYLDGIIIDCCPGQTDYMRTYNGAIVSLPSTLFGQLLGKPLLFLAVTLSTSLTHAGLVAGVKDYRRQLNDANVFGSLARRLYLYAKEDVVVGYKDVELHIKEAKEKGYEVENVCFLNSRHCSLPRGNEEKYWEIIKNFWEGSLSKKEDQMRCRL
ncbi:hypothetical protein TrVGV298_000115 [Trichoderma virens]|nr:hypothetical protein TrVGV298_000115 [Trichoderma virens]